MTSLAALPDNALVQRTVAGDTASFDVLAGRHMAAVRKRVQGIVNCPSDAEDLVQETLLKAWRALGTFRGDASFRTWLVRVATNEALQYRRSRRRYAATGEDQLENRPFTGETPLETLERVEGQRRLSRHIAALPSKYRQVLLLCDLQERTGQEAARSLGFGLPMLKSRLFRARRMLSESYAFSDA